jgi:hypothetical protein
VLIKDKRKTEGGCELSAHEGGMPSGRPD